MFDSEKHLLLNQTFSILFTINRIAEGYISYGN